LEIDKRNNLIFFFSQESNSVETNKNILGYYISKIFDYLGINNIANTTNDNYVYILNYDNSYYSNMYSIAQKEKQIEFREFGTWTKNIIHFYDRFNGVLTFFFKSVQFYIYEVNFTLFYYFFNVF